MSSQELANMLSISVSYLSQLEHGVRVNPNIELLLHLSEALHLSSEETEVLFDLYASVNDALSPEDANQTGTINATNQYFMACHIDKEHTHLHCVFNNPNCIDGRTFETHENRHTRKQDRSFKKLMNITDDLE